MNIRFFYAIYWILLIILSVNIICIHRVHAANTDLPLAEKLGLTPQEQTWLKAHPVIRFKGGLFPPFDFLDEENRSIGISIDVLKLIEKELEVDFRFESGGWKEILEQISSKQIDGITGIYKSPNRSEYMDFTDPYADNYYAIVMRKDSPPASSYQALKGMRVGTINKSLGQEYVKANYPQIKLVTHYTNYEEVLAALISGDIEAVLGPLTILSWFMDKLFVSNISVTGLIAEPKPKVRIGIRKDWPELVSILNKTIGVIPEDRLRSIFKKWVQVDLQPSLEKVPLSEEERRWLEKHPEVTLGFHPEIEPLLVVAEDGTVSGILDDIVEELKTVTDMNIRIDIDAWPSTIEKAKQGKIDGLLASVPALARSIGLSHSKIFVRGTPAVFARTDAPFEINSEQDLIGKRVVVLKGIYIVEQALAPYKEKIEILEADTAHEMLTLVLSGKADVAFGLSYHNYLIGKQMLVGIEPVYFSKQYSADAVASIRSEWPEFISIMNKGLDTIGQARLNTIANRWTNVEDKKTTQLVLTKEEKAWQKEHPEITIGFQDDWPPYSFLDTNNGPVGISIDFFDRVAQMAGIKYKVYPDGNWSGIYKAGQVKEVDIVASMAIRKYREEWFSLPRPFLTLSNCIITRKDYREIQHRDDLKGKKLSLVKDYWTTDDIMKTYPSAQVDYVNKGIEALREVSVGKADATVLTMGSALDMISRKGFYNLELSALYEKGAERITFGVRNDWPELASIIDKAIASITEVEKIKIMNRWILPVEKGEKIALTKEERTLLDARPVLRVGLAANSLPLSAFDEGGKPIGIVADYFQVLSDNTGLDFEFVSMTSPELLAAAGKRKIDLFAGFDTPERREYALFSDPLFPTEYIIIMRQDAPFIRGMNSLHGKKVSVIRNVAIHRYLAKNEPEMELVLSESVVEGLKAVSDGHVDAYIGDVVTSSYMINQENIVNLKIAAPADVPDDLIRIAVRNDLAEMWSIVNKVVTAIPSVQHDAILNKWISVTYQHEFDNSLIWKISGGAVFVFFLFFFWNRRLQREITARKQTQEALRLAKEVAETANRAKSEFLANMSHEIRTPLNAVIGFAQILQGKETDSKKNNYIKSIYSAGTALLSQINDILDLSKIEADKMDLKYSAVSVGSLFEEMKIMFEHRIVEKGLLFTTDIDKKTPRVLVLDETKLRQILVNLLGNAVKFTQDGHIRLSLQPDHANTGSSRVDLVFEVADTGIGIPRTEQDKIFDAFAQVKDRATADHDGTGLGLAISRRLVEMMGGEILVESQPGKGSIFRICLYGVEVAAADADEISYACLLNAESVYFSPATILIVDDIDYNLELCANFLEEWAFTNITATNGQEAIEKALEKQPDCILLDMRMPVMDGYEAAKKLKSDPNLAHIPVIAVTASALKQDEDRIGKLCDGYLRKPLIKDDLIRELMKHLPHERIETDKVTEPVMPEPQTIPVIREEPFYLPGPMYEELKSQVLIGHVKGIEKTIKKIALEDKGTAARLRPLVENYEFEKLLSLLKGKEE